MTSSTPNTPRAEFPKRRSHLLDGMTPDQQMRWFVQQSVDALNSLAAKAQAANYFQDPSDN